MAKETLNPPDALVPMARQAAWLMSRHPLVAGPWCGETGLDEIFDMGWPDQNTVLVRRSSCRGGPYTLIAFENLRLTGDIDDLSWTTEERISSGSEEHSLLNTDGLIRLAEGADLQLPFSYTFTKAESLLEASKTAVSNDLNLRLGAFASPAAATFTSKVELEYSKQFGDTKTESNTVGDTLTLKGPGAFDVVATRSIERVRRRIHGRPRIQCSIRVYLDYVERGANFSFPDIESFNDAIAGRAPDNVGDFSVVTVNTDPNRSPYWAPFAKWVREKGQLGMELDPHLPAMDTQVEYSPTYSPHIEVRRVDDV